MAVVVMALGLVMALLGPANADTTTVAGKSEITKMFVKNGADSVLVKVYGTGGKDEVRWVTVRVKGTDGVTYVAQGAWYSTTWQKSLAKGQKLVSCGGFKLTYNATGGFWRFLVPRTCLGKLTNKIKVSSELVASAPVPGEAGPTAWLRRG